MNAGAVYGMVIVAEGQKDMESVHTIKRKSALIVNRVRAKLSATAYLMTVMLIRKSASNAMTRIMDIEVLAIR